MFEVSIKNKRGYVVSLYRLPSQTQDDFDQSIAKSLSKKCQSHLVFD